ncbi:hypothetical protein SAMN04487979_11767 [Flavobacterium sp. ov086]|nr:hypothetical protein SAMN04487979_11767 [Flavobacterium sp. ov086]
MNKNNLFILVTKISIALVLYYIFIARNLFDMITPTIVLITIGCIYYNKQNKENQ